MAQDEEPEPADHLHRHRSEPQLGLSLERGTSTNPCSDTYGGSGPATEPEVVAVQDFIRNHGSIEIFVDFHAYSQLWLTPYGWTSATPPARDYEDQQGCAKAATEALTAVHGTK